MSRITASEARGLLEAYSAVYASQELTEEQIWEEVENWVNSLLEEGYDLSEYTWEEMYESYLEEAPMTAFQAAGGQAKLNQLNKGRSPRSGRATAASIEKQGQENLFKAGGGNAAIAKGPTRSQNVRGGGTRQVSTLTRQDIINRGAAAAGTKPAATPAAKPAATPAATPASAKVAPSAVAKPAGQTGDKAKDMATFAKANPKLAAASAEKARIRGTQQTDNPLMKDMKSRLPMNSPSVQSPNVAKLGKGNQSLVSNPNAFKAATPSKAIADAPSTSPAASGSVAPVTAKLAATPKPTPVAPRQTARERVLNQSYEYDAYDLVLEYLLSNGHADTVNEAHYVMLEMEAEVIQDIVEENKKN